MKKIRLVTGIVVLFFVLVNAKNIEAASKDSLIEVKQAIRTERIQMKLEVIRQKAGEEVKQKVADKIKIKETKIAEQKAATEKVELAKVEQTKIEQAVAESVVQEPVDSHMATEEVEVTTGASQSGREIGERNREYGQQLSDSNLSQEERQQIIQEKKEYNRSRR